MGPDRGRLAQMEMFPVAVRIIQPLRPITKDTANPLNQSKLEATTWKRGKHVRACHDWFWLLFPNGRVA